MTTWYCAYNVLAGNGNGTLGNPAWIYDMLDGNTTVPNGGGTISSYDTLVCLFDPDDPTGTKFSLGAAENLVVPTDLTIVGGDIDNSGAFTNVQFIIDGTSLSSGAILTTAKLTRLEGAILQNGPAIGLQFNAGSKWSTAYAVESNDNGSSGFNSGSTATEIKFLYCKAFDNGNTGFSINDASSTIYKCVAEGNTGGQITISGSYNNVLASIGHKNGAVSGNGIDSNSFGGNFLDCTALHTGTNAGGTGLRLSASMSGNHGGIALSTGSSTQRWEYGHAGRTGTFGQTAENNLSYNNQNVEAQNNTAYARYQSMATTDPGFGGGDPFDAAPTADLSTIKRVSALLGETTNIVPGAVPPEGGGDAGGVTIGPWSSGAWR